MQSVFRGAHVVLFILQPHHSTFGTMLHRVKFDTQSAANGEDIPLVNAAKTVFDSSKPSIWTMCAMLSPPMLWPVIRLLARMFPGKTMLDSQKAFQTLYDASDALIEVSFPAGRLFHYSFDRDWHQLPFRRYLNSSVYYMYNG